MFRLSLECAMASLVFIDTKIFLDLYRVQGGDTSLSVLDHFDGNYDRIITTTQVEMEYKKNRQAAVLRSLRDATACSEGQVTVPAVLRDAQVQRSMQAARQRVSEHTKRLRERTAKLIQEPARNDIIYKVLQQLFRSKRPCHFSRNTSGRRQIERLARKRFCLGYPPRKDGDTSIGDAVNWEWMIHCAIELDRDIVIVSRDSAYGAMWERDAILNDWLRQEFSERVGRKRTLTLTPRLTEGLDIAGIQVARAELEQEEREFARRAEGSKARGFDSFDMQKFLEELTALAEAFRETGS